jgi:hypothetical protein
VRQRTVTARQHTATAQVRPSGDVSTPRPAGAPVDMTAREGDRKGRPYAIVPASIRADGIFCVYLQKQKEIYGNTIYVLRHNYLHVF